MKKNKMSLTTELDLTREGTAEMTRWCILIALHQSFGIGAARLNKVLARAEKLGQESLDVAMTVNDRGMPSTDRSLALRRSWMPRNVDPDFRVPVLRSPRTRREEQLRMATWRPVWSGRCAPRPAWSRPSGIYAITSAG
jgi:hypothetical protein